MRFFLLPVLIATLLSCSNPTPNAKPAYSENVGDIAFDAATDDPHFKVCDEKRIFQYYNFGKGLQYKGEKTKINEYFDQGLPPGKIEGQSGFLTLRFVVNCEGKTGRFRILGMDNDYVEKEFDKDLVVRYLSLAAKMDGWIPGEDGAHKFDYYQYLTFKLKDGQLIEIMP